ncbi:hypothetical protein [Streptomyces uncialis]|uniref:hypothetical protein n=1 Tax=Streptomyces uncialis TaxID=1048205 RepID=UPI0033DBC86E
MPADALRMALVRWVLRIPTEHDAAEEALAERLALTGVTFVDEPVTALKVAPVDVGLGRSQRSVGRRQ